MVEGIVLKKDCGYTGYIIHVARKQDPMAKKKLEVEEFMEIGGSEIPGISLRSVLILGRNKDDVLTHPSLA